MSNVLIPGFSPVIRSHAAGCTFMRLSQQFADGCSADIDHSSFPQVQSQLMCVTSWSAQQQAVPVGSVAKLPFFIFKIFSLLESLFNELLTFVPKRATNCMSAERTLYPGHSQSSHISCLATIPSYDLVISASVCTHYYD